METHIDVILFDIDGTLFDQKLAHVMALKEICGTSEMFEGIREEVLIKEFSRADRLALEDFNRGVPIDVVREERSEMVLKALGLDPELSREFTSLFYRIYPTMRAGFPEVEDVIERAMARYRIGIISNGSKDVQREKLVSLGLTGQFEVEVYSEAIGIRKPDRRIFEHASERMGVHPSRCMYVGDLLEVDVVGGRGAGMSTCWINHHGEIPHGQGPDLEISEIRDLLEYIR